jgi:2-polyprenyl-3-methyl-5-hydroxy-6-metoxy-1,4-benzoquinol methylase
MSVEPQVNAQQLWENSSQAWIDLMRRGDLNRTVLLDPVMLRLAGDVRGMDVCDVGCGEGRFCRMLAEMGANVVGVEPTRGLIEEAKALHSGGQYLEAGAEAIPVAADTFDLVVCYLVLIDIGDYRAAIHEMARIAKPGGRLLVANLNSFCTTRSRAWIRDDEGQPLHVGVDNYFEERSDVLAWSGIEIVNHHRPFESYVKAFLDAGLRLINFEEPAPSHEEAAEMPWLADGLRVPLFHVMQWRKD